MRSFTSIEILPSVPVRRPRKQPTSPMRSRTVCQAISGWPRPSSAISAACTLRPSPPSDARVQLRQALAMALHGGKQRRHLEAEGERYRLLQVAAPGHRRVAVAARKIGERGGDRLHVLFDRPECGADLQDRRRVGDVLGGCAPMAPFAESVGTERYELLHHAEDRIADTLGLLLETGEIDILDPALALDLARGLFRNDAKTALHARQRCFDFQVVAGARLIGKNLPHFWRAENVAKNRGVERRCGHVLLQTLLRHARQRSQACADCVNLPALPGIHAFCAVTKTWMAPQLGVARVAHIKEVPQVG